MIGGLVAVGLALVAIALALRALWHGRCAGRLADQARNHAAAPRGPDAGTTNQWTVAGGVEVHAYGPHRVLGRTSFGPQIVVGRPDTPVLVFTAHQARALAEVLPAAAALCDEFDEGAGAG